MSYRLKEYINEIEERWKKTTPGPFYVERRDDEDGYFTFIVHGASDFAWCQETLDKRAKFNGLKFKRRWVGHSSYCEYDRPDLDGSPAGILVPPRGTLKDRFNPTLEYHNTGDEPLRIMQVKINYGDPEVKHEEEK